jgi:hypothetical protein
MIPESGSHGAPRPNRRIPARRPGRRWESESRRDEGECSIDLWASDYGVNPAQDALQGRTGLIIELAPLQ